MLLSNELSSPRIKSGFLIIILFNLSKLSFSCGDNAMTELLVASLVLLILWSTAVCLGVIRFQYTLTRFMVRGRLLCTFAAFPAAGDLTNLDALMIGTPAVRMLILGFDVVGTVVTFRVVRSDLDGLFSWIFSSMSSS
uniref:Uncharacterized protein n=1 Tax=Cacopsylla melanoneura TaxID=428564 RepID=A0A8D8WQU7_9HEMI